MRNPEVPRLEPVPAAPEGTIPGDLLAQRPEALALFPEGILTPEGDLERELVERHAQPSRLPEEAFHATGPETVERLRRILKGEGVFVTTGQQPLLFLGPLYVLYKAATAIRLARSIESRLGIPAIALFWIAADDHDWREVARTRLVRRDGEVTELRVSAPAGWERRSVGPAPIPDDVGGVLDEFLTLSEVGDPWARVLREAYAPRRGFSGAFGECLAHAFAGWDLVWLDAAAEAVRGAAVPLVRSVLDRPDEVVAALAAGCDSVSRAGYRPTLDYLPGALPLFFDSGTSRVRLYVEGDVLRQGRDGPPRPIEWFRAEVERRPGAFGPNVALRPVLESWLLPVAATVLGPGEIRYWAHLAPLFRELGAGMPVVARRDSWFVIEPPVQRVLERIGIAPDDLADGGKQVAERVTAGARPAGVMEALARIERDLDAGFDALAQAVGEELPGERAAAEKARAGARKALEGFRRKVDARVRERKRVLLEQIARATGHLFPLAQPQERIASCVPYVARYGDPFVRRLIDAGAGDDGGANGNRSGPDAPGKDGVAGVPGPE